MCLCSRPCNTVPFHAQYSTSISKMFASAGGKQRRVSSHSDDLRRLALHNSYWQRRKAEMAHTKDSANQPDISQSSVTFRPIRPVIDDRSIARSSSTTSMANTYVLALRSLGRRTTTSLDFPLHHSWQASRDRQHLSSPTRRNNPHPNGLVYQSSYNRHNKVRMWVCLVYTNSKK